MAKQFYNISEITFAPHPNDKRFTDLTGQTFGRLTVLGLAGRQKRKLAWFCQCRCGHITRVLRDGLVSNTTQSCGCRLADIVRARSVTHGATGSPEYRAFRSAHQRCTNPSYIQSQDYKDRGIQFRFKSFQEFISDIGLMPQSPERLSLDRIDNDGHYEAGNVRWATYGEQRRNSRTAHYLTIGKHTKCLTDWAEYVEISMGAISRRVHSHKFCPMCAVFAIANQTCTHTLTASFPPIK